MKINTLIELYDVNNPIFNVLSATVFRPEGIVVLGDARIRRNRLQKPLRNYLELAGITPQLQWEICNLYDVHDLSARLEALFSEYDRENSVLDVTGGSETLLLAAGRYCVDGGVSMILHRLGVNRVRWLTGPRAGEESGFDIRISIRQAIALAGGEFLRHGHASGEELTLDMQNLIRRVFPIYRRHRACWVPFVQYLQLVNRPENYRDGVLYAPQRVRERDCDLTVNRQLLSALEKAGAVADVRENVRVCSFRFHSDEVARYLCDVGVWLELYLYTIMQNSELFDDVELNAVVSWDDDSKADDVENEIDVTATAGIGQLFISCKSASPDVYALQEVATLTRRFGSRFATPVIATMSSFQPSLSRSRKWALPSLMWTTWMKTNSAAA